MSSPSSSLSLGASSIGGGDGDVGVAPGVGNTGGSNFGPGSGRGGISGAFILSMEAGGVMKTEEATGGGFFTGV